MKTSALLAIPVLLLASALAACSPGGGGTDSGVRSDVATTTDVVGTDIGTGTDVLPGTDVPVIGDSAADPCALATDCASCTAMGMCGWCSAGAARCLSGTATGSNVGACMGASWDWTGTTCGGGDAAMTCSPGVPRACNLTLAGAVRTCTAGAMVTVGCNQGCSTPLGTCSGDPVIQICPGSATAPCAMDIAHNDDGLTAAACGGSSDAGTGNPDGGVNVNLCPVTTFVCPTNGMYTIWTGAYGTRAATCNPAAR